MKTITVGLAGTGAYFTLERYNAVAAGAAATFTALYMGFKCLDWIIGKLRKRKQTTPPEE